MTPTKLGCPKCKRTVPEVYWQGVDVARCPACEGEFEQLRFPALAAKPRVVQAAALAAGEAQCYFHTQNRAEIACAGCGRYVCAVCRVAVSGQEFCPSCLEVRTDRRKLPENHRVLYDHLALVLAFVPLIIWPFTLIAAPAAIGMCFYGWKKPGSILSKPRKWRFIVAGVGATIEMVIWVVVLGKLILR